MEGLNHGNKEEKLDIKIEKRTSCSIKKLKEYFIIIKYYLKIILNMYNIELVKGRKYERNRNN